MTLVVRRGQTCIVESFSAGKADPKLFQRGWLRVLGRFELLQ